jgi:nitroreductase
MTVAPVDVRVIADVDEVLETSGTVRHRLDFDRPADSGVVTRCVEIAQQATMGSNLEEWRGVAVFDPERKLAIAEIYREIYEEMVARPFREADAAVLEHLDPARRGDPDEAQRQQRTITGVKHLADNLERVPSHLLRQDPAAAHARGQAGVGLRRDHLPVRLALSAGAPRQGHRVGDSDGRDASRRRPGAAARAARRLTLVAVIPAAYTRATEFRRARRKPLGDILCFERWGRDA